MLQTIKALADSTRLRLVAVLSRGEFTVQELTSILNMGQSRISRHLKILLEEKILFVKRQGTWSYYRLLMDNPFFREIFPSLEKRFDTLPDRDADLSGLAKVLDERRIRSLEFFDLHAKQWDTLVEEALPTSEYLDAFWKMVPSCNTILEVGVGTGRLLKALRQKGKRVLGVDHSPAMLGEAQKRIDEEGLSGTELRLGEMHHLPVGDGEVDCVVVNMVLHHAADPAGVLMEFRRVISRGGVLTIADLHRHEKEWVREGLADQWLGFEESELGQWFETAGFKNIRLEKIPASGEKVGVILIKGEKAV